ncbi:hypothetical protein M0R04_13630 [Candidatus Dojkabacteria bacterium]|jgi:hypothetical protein|nr:hypothetical protein [Candidatus Dojkabacteria bacterium]
MVKDTKRGVVIGTSEYTKDFLRPLLDSIKKIKYNVLIVSNGGFNPNNIIAEFLKENRLHKDWCSLAINTWNGWEIGVIQRGKETFSEFVHIMDTTLIKDITLFDKLFAIEGNVVLTKGNFHYMGKFVTKELPNLPRVHDKVTAIMLETKWLDGFKYTEMEPDLPVHSLQWEMIHGMKRMRLENQYLIKWKGTAYVSAEQHKELMEELQRKNML